MFVKMKKPGSDRIHKIPAKEVAIYEKKGWSLVETKVKRKVEVIEEPVIATEQLDLDLNEEHE
jgi:hypothetical protein